MISEREFPACFAKKKSECAYLIHGIGLLDWNCICNKFAIPIHVVSVKCMHRYIYSNLSNFPCPVLCELSKEELLSLSRFLITSSKGITKVDPKTIKKKAMTKREKRILAWTEKLAAAKRGDHRKLEGGHY